jgi:hypothetical protein
MAWLNTNVGQGRERCRETYQLAISAIQHLTCAATLASSGR